MASLTLTDMSVRNLQPPEKGQRLYVDKTLPGFGVRVSQGGAKTFVVVLGTKRSYRTLGRYPSLSLQEARRAAKTLIAEHTLGTLPLFVRKPTDALGEYLRESAKKNRPKTVSEYQRLLAHFPADLVTATRHQVQRSLNKLIVSPSEHDHALVAVRVFFNWCIAMGYRPDNPAQHIPKIYHAMPRSNVVSETTIVKLLENALQSDETYDLIVGLLVTTGQRRGEIATLCWDYIDTDKRTITFPGNTTKNHQAHFIPYGTLTQRIIDNVPRNSPNFLFPANRFMSDRTSTFNGWSKAKKSLDKALKIKEDFTLHDLRRTFSTTHASLGTPIQVTEKLLNHTSGTHSGVQAVYNRYRYEKEMRAAVETLEGHFDMLLYASE